MAVDTNNIRKTNFEMFEETAICMQCTVCGVPFAYEKKMKASLFGCGRIVSLIPGKD